MRSTFFYPLIEEFVMLEIIVWAVYVLGLPFIVRVVVAEFRQGRPQASVLAEEKPTLAMAA